MDDLALRFAMAGIIALLGLIVTVFYGRDGGKSRLEILKTATTPKGALPLPVITPEFEQRFYRRVKNEKRGIAAGFVCMAVAAFFLGIDAGMYTYAIALLIVFSCRALANMLDRSHELRSASDSPLRYSRGRFLSLTDYIPAWAIISIALLSTASLVITFIFTAPYSVSGWRPYVFIPASVICIAASWYASARIASQPVFATSEADLRWEDYLITNDVNVLPLLGSFLPILIISFQYPEKSSAILALILCASATATGIIVGISSYSAHRHLWPDPSYHPQGKNSITSAHTNNSNNEKLRGKQ